MGLGVTGIGMATSLGLGAIDSCAAARAGLARLTELTTLNVSLDPNLAKEGVDGVPPFFAHVVPIVGTGSSGLAKLLSLAKPALRDLAQNAGLDRARLSRTGLCINVSDRHFHTAFSVISEPVTEDEPADPAAQWRSAVEALPGRLCAECDVPIPPHAHVVVGGGHVGVVDALRHAVAMMQSGLVDRCIVGGIESCVEPAAIASYAAAGVVKSAANPAGFFPGEAAAFFLVEPLTARPLRGTMRIAGVAEATDVAYLQPGSVACGQGIADVISRALNGRAKSGGLPPLVVSDMNGTEARANDWGHALVRLRENFGDVPFDTWLPAQSFGETGAAAGALAIAVAARASERGYAPGPSALIVLASESGRRAAVLLDRSHVNGVS
jgi:3-oxoacyl-[acyl-carrier-protein] synthase-1